VSIKPVSIDLDADGAKDRLLAATVLPSSAGTPLVGHRRRRRRRRAGALVHDASSPSSLRRTERLAFSGVVHAYSSAPADLVLDPPRSALFGGVSKA
jgi:hypothetical protein